MDVQYNIIYEIFCHKPKAVVDNIIRIVEENSYHLSHDEQLESMINLLSESGVPENGKTNIKNVNLSDKADDFSDGMINLFYEANAVENQIMNIKNAELFDEAVGFNNRYEDAASATLKRLVDIFPDADPSYLEKQASELSLNETKLENFIYDHVESKDYPKLEEYLRKQSELLEMDKYLAHFRFYQFLLEFPDPIEHFNKPDRKHALCNVEDNENTVKEKEFALTCLCNQFLYLREADVRKVFKICGNNVVATYKKLKRFPPAFKAPRKKLVLPDISVKNMNLLQEIAFIQHEEEIKNAKKEKELNYLRAKELGLLENCNCCCTDDLIPEDCFLCKNGCKFCRECIRKCAEIGYAEGKTEFKCLADCGANYSLETLQRVLSPKTFTNLCHTIQMQEVQNADIPGLEYCPLCSNWAMIPDEEDKIFHCESCNKDSCRECKHEAHVPKRCNEIEYDEDVKIRTYIENKMTEALLRKCYKCSAVFVKNHGCNKITCSCGATMCYLCQVPVTGYSHFNTGSCPLYTNDEEVHLNNVMKGANTAKADMGVDKNPKILKFDPARNFRS